MFHVIAGPGLPWVKRRVVITMRSAFGAISDTHFSNAGRRPSVGSNTPMKPYFLTSSSDDSPEDQAEANYKERSQSTMKDELDQGVVPIRKAQPVPIPQKAPLNWAPGEVRR